MIAIDGDLRSLEGTVIKVTDEDVLVKPDHDDLKVDALTTNGTPPPSPSMGSAAGLVGHPRASRKCPSGVPSSRSASGCPITFASTAAVTR